MIERHNVQLSETPTKIQKMNISGSKACGCGCGETISANKDLKFGHKMPKPKAVRKPRAKKEAVTEKIHGTKIAVVVA